MDCSYHPGVAAAGYCSSCGRAVCQACLMSASGRTVCPLCAKAAAPVPPAAGPPAAVPASAPKSSSGLFVVLGCVALVLVLLVGAAVGGYFWYRSTRTRPTAVKGSKPSDVVRNMEGVSEEPSEKAPPVQPPEAPPAAVRRPSEALAKQTALGDKTNWKAKVVYNTPDWQRVKVYTGPASGEYTTSVVLQWDGKTNSYRVERTGPIPKPEPTGPKPSRAGAIAAAKSGYGNMVAKVVSHSGDWTRATIYLGEPYSEFIYAVTVQWTGSGYRVVDRASIDQPGWGDEAPEEEYVPDEGMEPGEGDPSDPNATDWGDVDVGTEGEG